MQRHDIEITSGNLRKLKMKWFYRIRKSIRKNIVTKIVEIQVQHLELSKINIL